MKNLKNGFKITYDPEADAMYISLKNIKRGQIDHTKEVSNLVFIDVDKKNNPMGIEILDVSRRFGFKMLKNIPVEILGK